MADSGPGAAPCDVFPGVREQERLADTIGPDALLMADSGPGAAPCDVFPGVRKQERLADTIGPDAAAAPGPLYVGGAFGPTWPGLHDAGSGSRYVGWPWAEVA